MTWVCNDCLSCDPDKLQIHNIIVCTTDWLYEIDVDALEQLLTPHNETLLNEGFNELLLGSDDSQGHEAASDSQVCKVFWEC